MNTRNAALIAVPVLALTLTACGGDDSEYELKGEVTAKQAEWDCESAHAMTLNGVAIAPVAQSRASGGSRGGSVSTSGGGRGGTTSGGSKSTSGSRSGGASGGGGAAVKPKPKPKKITPDLIPNDGAVTLPKKPKGKSCKPDYELFVRNDTGTFEQDVISEHYDRCTKGEKFPACVKES